MGVTHALVALLVTCTVAQAQNRNSYPARRQGDPPRIAARNLYEYRHMQLFNPEYVAWVRENILPVHYYKIAGAFESKWLQVAQAPARNHTEVIMVTQATPSRLPAFKLVVKEWKGPVSVSVFIEFPSNSTMGAICRERVLTFIQLRILGEWAHPESSPPVSVSFLHTNVQQEDANCDIPGQASPVYDADDEANNGDVWVGNSEGATVELTEDAAKGAAFLSGQDAVGDVEQNGASVGHQTGGAAHRYGTPIVPKHTINRFDHTKPRSLLRRERTLKQPQPNYAGTLKPMWRMEPQFGGPLPQETPRPWRETYDSFYPVNALRNLAWSQVPSGAFVFLNDIDFIPTPNLYFDLTFGRWREELVDMSAAFLKFGRRQALVTPAFERLAHKGVDGQPVVEPFKEPCLPEMGCEMLQGMALPRNFATLRKMLQPGKLVDVFHRRVFAAGHGCYSWYSWLQDPHPEKMVNVTYSHPCEPYVIALSDALPRYDERFRGRGQNKVEQLTHMAMWGFEWRLLPSHFVLHVPHASTSRQVGGWDVPTTPIALMKSKIEEIEKEPQFKRHVAQEVPLALKIRYD